MSNMVEEFYTKYFTGLAKNVAFLYILFGWSNFGVHRKVFGRQPFQSSGNPDYGLTSLACSLLLPLLSWQLSPS